MFFSFPYQFRCAYPYEAQPARVVTFSTIPAEPTQLPTGDMPGPETKPPLKPTPQQPGEGRHGSVEHVEPQ